MMGTPTSSHSGEETPVTHGVSNSYTPHANGLSPYRGKGTLPAASGISFVTFYIDAQYDYLENRLCSIAALIVGTNGNISSRRYITQIAKAPPAGRAEQTLVADFVRSAFTSIQSLKDVSGASAPLHLIYFDQARRLLLEGLNRCLENPDSSDPQVAAFYDLLTSPESPGNVHASTCVADELARFNYPLVCPSLQSVAAYLGFKFSEDVRRAFHYGHFDTLGRTTSGELFTKRARFSSQLPLEYFYAAWQALPEPPGGGDPYARYRWATPELLEKLIGERLDALDHIVTGWQARGQVNNRIRKPILDLDRLPSRDDRARSLACSLAEYLLSERLSRLSQWHQARLQPPEVRVEIGDSLIGRYREAVQSVETRRANREHQEQIERNERWNHDGLRVRLSLTFARTGDGKDSVKQTLLLFRAEPGDRVLVSPRFVCDERLPLEQRVWHTPTSTQMVYAAQADVDSIETSYSETGEPTGAEVYLVMRSTWGNHGDPYMFSTVGATPFYEGATYVIDPCPSDPYLKSQASLIEHITRIQVGANPGRHVLYERLASHANDLPSNEPLPATRSMSELGRTAQGQFFTGLEFFAQSGLLFEVYDANDRKVIGECGDVPVLLVQGPPGTAKTSKGAWAILARLQAAIVTGTNARAIAVANTHAAADVILQKLVDAQNTLRRFQKNDPIAFGRYFDDRLLDVALFRAAPPDDVPGGVTALPRAENRGTRDKEGNADKVRSANSCVVVGTPGGVYGIFKDRWMTASFLKRYGSGLIVIDEASRVTLPEALLAGLTLTPEGQLLVLGDHRQLPPIQQHDWKSEPRRTFQRYDSCKSLFEFLLARNAVVPVIRFSRSFRCPPQVASFLSEAVYAEDGIAYHSMGTSKLTSKQAEDAFVDAVLSPDAAMVVVLHGEERSQTENAFERALLAPLLATLTDPTKHGLDTKTGVGVVAVHRHQRAALLAEHPNIGGAVHTVEKYQGGERDVILVSATESDPYFIQSSSEFLLDPRRLCVAISRAKKKVVLVASRSVFRAASLADDEKRWAASLVWQRLLRQHCTRLLWTGQREDKQVTVWGTPPMSD